MCGRFSIIEPDQIIRKRFDATFAPEVAWKPRYNAAPSEHLPIIKNDDPKRLVLSRWGIEPSWMKDRPGRKELINARAEGLLEKRTFIGDFRERRCLIPADGFYEWKRAGKGKVPYRITLRSRELFAFAGLWRLITEGKEKGRTAFVIITTEPNELMAEIHNRMPVILRKDFEKIWLGAKATPEQLMKLLTPYPSSKLMAYEVDRLVNSPSNDVPAVIRPVGV